MATEVATRVSTDGPGLLSPVASPHAAEFSRPTVYDRVVEASFERGGGGPAAAVVEHATPSSSTDFSPGKILATHLASQYPATVLLRAAGLRAEGAAVTPTALFAREASPERADSPASSVDSQGTVGSETEDDEVAGLLAPPPRAERSLSDRDAAELLASQLVFPKSLAAACGAPDAPPPAALERPRPRRSGAPPGATAKPLPEAAADRLRGAAAGAVGPGRRAVRPGPHRLPRGPGGSPGVAGGTAEHPEQCPCSGAVRGSLPCDSRLTPALKRIIP